MKFARRVYQAEGLACAKAWSLDSAWGVPAEWGVGGKMSLGVTGPMVHPFHYGEDFLF